MLYKYVYKRNNNSLYINSFVSFKKSLYIFPLHLQYIQVSEEFINNPNVFTEMKIFCTLFWTAIVAIVVERCKAEFLLVEIDDAAGKGKPFHYYDIKLKR